MDVNSEAQMDSSGGAPEGAARTGRLAGKTALITGAAGNLGTWIADLYAAEGAHVIMTGRSRGRIDEAREKLIERTSVPEDRVTAIVLDGGEPDSVRAALGEVQDKFRRLDILVNNAGSAGPKQTLDNVPLSDADLEALNAEGANESETVADAFRNILGVTWNLSRTAAPLMPVGGSIVNVSTIFSHTRYFGRTAYVVPKAALNALSKGLALELGPKGIRVNLLYPGPIESERIRTVFAAMDQLQGNVDGATAANFLGLMSLERSIDNRAKELTFPRPIDIARTCVFLGSNDSAAFNGHDFDVTHGMSVEKNPRSTYLTRPAMRSLDGTGLAVLIAAGEEWEDALEIARIQMARGAKVLLGLSRQADVAQAEARVRAQGAAEGLTIVRFNRSDPDGMEQVLETFTSEESTITSAIFMPVKAPDYFQGSLLDASDAAVKTFMEVELQGAIALGRTFARYWKCYDDMVQEPRFVFMSNPSDHAGNLFNAMQATAIAELVTIWCDESRVEQKLGRMKQPPWGNQIVRFTNEEEENTRFAGGHAARILFREHRIRETILEIPESIGEATGARKALLGPAENISGLHLGKVALITGGSAGIGWQVARLLALAGAKVMIVARREDALRDAKQRIVEELLDGGFAGVDRRVQTLANVDVGDPESLQRAVEATLEAFGRIDYLINNAGIAGAEDMVIDMDIDAWRRTLNANLISNYVLMHQVVPLMKQQGSGYVLNVSSYFGGEKYLAVAYPNRADYAVSKAGQRAMVESFARFLGPEVQFNAIAPGPVDGDRLAGVGEKPGLFERRARLILENIRLNSVYAAVVRSVRGGASVGQALSRLARNDSAYLSHNTDTPAPLRDVALECAREGDGICTWDRFLLNGAIAARLIVRLKSGGLLQEEAEWAELASNPESASGWLKLVPPDDVPFLPEERVKAEAAKVRTGVLSQLHLGRMPTEADVAQATVFYLADRAVSGETFMPSGGLQVERSTTERELFGSPKAERLEQMRDRTVWIVGQHLSDYIAETVRQLVLDIKVKQVVLLTKTEADANAILQIVPFVPGEAIKVVAFEDDVELAMDTALERWGAPITVISTPLRELPDRLFEDEEPLSPAEFSQVVEDNVTQHFRVARKASLYDDCQIVLASPDVPQGTLGPAFAIANFVKTTLHAFTETLAVENERVIHDVPVNQVNLTRRVQSEEPRDLNEHKEEVKRFVRAVLLVGAPLPDAEDSRYRARIYRGTSMTV